MISGQVSYQQEWPEESGLHSILTCFELGHLCSPLPISAYVQYRSAMQHDLPFSVPPATPTTPRVYIFKAETAARQAYRGILFWCGPGGGSDGSSELPRDPLRGAIRERFSHESQCLQLGNDPGSRSGPFEISRLPCFRKPRRYHPTIRGWLAPMGIHIGMLSLRGGQLAGQIEGFTKVCGHSHSSWTRRLDCLCPIT